MKTIVHCDDLGMTGQITLRILEAWRQGLLDGFSVIANGDALSDASSGLRETSDRGARIAVHLNLSEGRALIPASQAALIADPYGDLNSSFGGLIKFWAKSLAREKDELLRQVEKEWRAQIETVIEAVRPRSVQAIDGHTHVHMIPFLFPIAAKLAVEKGIPEIRISQEPFYVPSRIKDIASLGVAVNIAKHLVLHALASKARAVAKMNGLKGPEAFVGILYTGRMTHAAARAGIEAARKKKAESVEVLFHIGRASPDEAKRWEKNPREGIFPLNKDRDAEYRELILFGKERSR